MTEPTPEQLFRRFRERGDAAALGAVFDAVAPQLLLVAAHLAGDTVAEDLVQATFLDAIEQRQRWDGVRPLAPWLCGILGMHVRRARQRRRHVDASRLSMPVPPSPVEAAETAELCEAVRAAVAALPLAYHQVLSLRFLHGLELRHIAHSLRLPVGTVKTRLHRGMAMLKRALPAGLAPAMAAVATRGRGLAAVREVVIGQCGAAVGAAAATAGAATIATGAMLGAMAMQKSIVGLAVLIATAVGLWWAMTAPAADVVVAAAPPAIPAVVAAAVDAAPRVRTELIDAPASAATAPAADAPPAADSIFVLATDAATHAPIENFGLRASMAPDLNMFAPEEPLLHGGAHPGGRLLLREADFDRRVFLLEDGEHRYPPSRWFALTDAKVQAGVRTIELSLSPNVAVELTVVRDDNHLPIAGTKVELLRRWPGTPDITQRTAALPAASFRAQPGENAMVVALTGGRALLLSGGSTDAQGVVHLLAPPGEELVLRLCGPRHQPALRSPWIVDAAPGPVERTEQVVAGASIHGRVLPAEALAQLRRPLPTPGPGLRAEMIAGYATGVRLVNPATHETIPPMRGMLTSPVPLAEDGTFAVDGLSPGDWQMFFTFPVLEERPDLPPQLRTLPAATLMGVGIVEVELPLVRSLQTGETRIVDIDVADLVPGQLDATLTIDGAPPPAGCMLVWPMPQPGKRLAILRSTPNLRPGSNGRIAGGLPPGRYTAIWNPDTGRSQLPLGEFTIASGATANVAFAIETTSRILRVFEADGSTPARGQLQLRQDGGDGAWIVEAGTDAGGVATFELLPRGVPLRAAFYRAVPAGAAALAKPREKIDLGPLPAVDAQGAILRLPPR